METKLVRHFQQYSSDVRADRAASFRLGHVQRQAIGEVFWTHPSVPGVAFKTRKAAIQAAARSVNP